MLNKVSDFFKRLNTMNENTANETISLEIACAVLLCEVMRADHHFDEKEQQALRKLLEEKFSLSSTEISEIITKALTHSENSNDLFTYTSLINQAYQVDQKIALVKQLWQLALADGNIAAVEHHTIRKIADLLHLRHSEYVSTKPKTN